MENQSKTGALLLKRKANNDSVRSKWGLTSFRVMLLGLIASTATYSHFYGVSYLNGKLVALGFNGVAVELSTGQSMHFAVEGYIRGLTMAMRAIFDVSTFLIIVSVFIGLTILYVNWKNNFNSLWLTISSKIDNVQITINLRQWAMSGVRVFSIIALPILTFLWSYSVLVLSLTVLILVVSLIVAFIGLGSLVGNEVGQAIAAEPICYKVELEKRRSLGCQTLTLKNGEELKGQRLLSLNGVEYFLTNDGAYEVKEQVVIAYTPTYCLEANEQAAQSINSKHNNKRCSNKPYKSSDL